MSHYEQRLERDLKQIREQVADVGTRVQAGLKDAMHALLTGNDKLAYATILGDLPINRRVRSIDRCCHSFIAQHLPSGSHLRLISSVIRTNIELERIGDYAVTICRESVQMPQPPQGVLAGKLELMYTEASRMLDQTLNAFTEGNADIAKATMSMAKQVDRAFGNTFIELTTEEDKCSLQDLMRLFNVFHRLERVAAQAKNICEETVFAVTGETKTPKIYRILFLDEDCSGLSQMAEAIACRRFPNSGHYSRAGRYAASTLNPAIAAFLQERGLVLENNMPKALDLTPQELADFHVIVNLQGPIKSVIQETPFHTAVQEWDIPPLTDGLDAEQTLQRIEAIYRELSVHVQELMHTLRGHEAA